MLYYLGQTVVDRALVFVSPQYRAWLQSNFSPSPFNDEETVGALLSQYKEQQESQRRGVDHRWINQRMDVAALPPDSGESEGNS